MAAVHDAAARPADDAIRAIEEVVGGLFQQLHHAELPRALDLRTRLDADLGFDSLARVELLSRLERVLQLEIPAEDFGSLDTIADLLKVLSKARGQARTSGAQSPTVPAATARSAQLREASLPMPVRCHRSCRGERNAALGPRTRS